MRRSVLVKLSEWARSQGVSYKTALNWFHAGNLPVPARQLPTGTILVEPPRVSAGVTVAYCRVSSSDQKADLERQAGRVAVACSQRGLTVEYVDQVLVASGRPLVVLDESELRDDLVQDMVEVLTSMCARLYGRRSARRRAEAAFAAAESHGVAG